jgi:predicted enzyme related to lactoylglutathione lyase
MGRVIHFEITAADRDRTAGFYAKAFGWETTASPFATGYLLTATGVGDGIDGAIMSRDHQTQPAILWIEVDDIDASVAAVTAAGGTTRGKFNDIPGAGRVGYVRDPDGMLLGLRQPTQKND